MTSLPSPDSGNSVVKILSIFSDQWSRMVLFFFFFCGADMTPQQLTTLEMRKDVPNGWNGINANKRRGNNRNTKQLTTARCRSSPWHDITDGRRDAVVFPVGQCVLGKANVHPDAQPNGAGDWRTPLEYDQRRYAEAKVSGIARQQDVQLSPLLAIVWEMGKVERRGGHSWLAKWATNQAMRKHIPSHQDANEALAHRAVCFNSHIPFRHA